jgi:hypothetical protein
MGVLVAHSRLAWLVCELAVVLPLALWMSRTRDGASSRFGWDLDARALAVIAIVIGAFVLILARWWSRGILWGDEAAYRFQARIFATGHLWASDAVPTAASAATHGFLVPFTHHLVHDGHWFTKYPPGWPLLLAPAQAIGLGWIVNPLLAVAAAIMIARVARAELDAPPRLAAAMLIASPFFFLMAASTMSHLFALVLELGAAAAFLSGNRTRRAGPVLVAIALVGACMFVRPYSAVCAALALTPFVLALLWRERRLIVPVVAGGAAILALVVFAMAIYDRAYTGHAGVSPYALYHNSATPLELSLSPRVIAHNLAETSRWGLEDTFVCAFPLVFVLAGYALVVDRAHRTQHLVLAAFFVAAWIANLLHTEGSSSRFGDRYLFEAYFAPVLMGARGAALWIERRRIPGRRASALVLGLLAADLVTSAIVVPPVVAEIRPYVRVHDVVDALPPDGRVVFFPITPAFTGDRFDLNAADAADAPHVFLVDPGAGLRDGVTAALGRRAWVVIGWDDDASAPFTRSR